jgi:hypothetical protein
MKNFVVIVSYKDNLSTHLFGVKAFSGIEAKLIAKKSWIDNYEYVLPINEMIEDEDIGFTIYEINEETFK